MTDKRTTITLGDIHAPHHDKLAFEFACQLVELLQPGRVIQGGDFVDNYILSRHVTDPRVSREWYLKNAMDVSRNVADRLRKATGDGVLWCTSGNHDDWLMRYLMTRAPELIDTHPTTASMLGFDAGHWIGYQVPLVFGKMAYVHDLGFCGISATRSTMLAYGDNIVFFHSHRASILYAGETTGRRIVCMNGGYLADPEHAKYANVAAKRDWIHGIGRVVEDRQGLVQADFFPFIKDSQGRLTARIDGQTIAAKRVLNPA